MNFYESFKKSLKEADQNTNLSDFNNILGEWDFVQTTGDVTEPYIAGVEINGDNINIAVELWDPDLDDYVSIDGGTIKSKELADKILNTDFYGSGEAYQKADEILGDLYPDNWNELCDKLYDELHKKLREEGYEDENGNPIEEAEHPMDWKKFEVTIKRNDARGNFTTIVVNRSEDAVRDFITGKGYEVVSIKDLGYLKGNSENKVVKESSDKSKKNRKSVKLDDNSEKAYIKYVRDWMDDRGFNIDDELSYWSGHNKPYNISDYKKVFDGLYDENGINGELFVSYNEFLNNEYQELNEMENSEGLTNINFVDYCEGKVTDLGTVDVNIDDETIPVRIAFEQEIRNYGNCKVLNGEDTMDKLDSDGDNLEFVTEDGRYINTPMMNPITLVGRLEFDKIDEEFYKSMLVNWDDAKDFFEGEGENDSEGYKYNQIVFAKLKDGNKDAGWTYLLTHKGCDPELEVDLYTGKFNELPTKQRKLEKEVNSLEEVKQFLDEKKTGLGTNDFGFNINSDGKFDINGVDYFDNNLVHFSDESRNLKEAEVGEADFGSIEEIDGVKYYVAGSTSQGYCYKDMDIYYNLPDEVCYISESEFSNNENCIDGDKLPVNYIEQNKAKLIEQGGISTHNSIVEEVKTMLDNSGWYYERNNGERIEGKDFDDKLVESFAEETIDIVDWQCTSSFINADLDSDFVIGETIEDFYKNKFNESEKLNESSYANNKLLDAVKDYGIVSVNLDEMNNTITFRVPRANGSDDGYVCATVDFIDIIESALKDMGIDADVFGEGESASDFGTFTLTYEPKARGLYSESEGPTMDEDEFNAIDYFLSDSKLRDSGFYIAQDKNMKDHFIDAGDNNKKYSLKDGLQICYEAMVPEYIAEYPKEIKEGLEKVIRKYLGDAKGDEVKSWCSSVNESEVVNDLPQGNSYWVYVSKNGIGPGAVPEDVVIYIPSELPKTNKTLFCVDRQLTPEEMEKYDIELFDNNYFNKYPEVVEELMKLDR